MSRFLSLVRRIFLVAAVISVPAVGGAQIAVVGSTQDERATRPGETYTGSITVVNESDTEQNVRVYQTDYMFFADGNSPFAAPGTSARSNAGWVRPSATTLRMAPRSQSVVMYQVSVPASDTLRGTYWSTIMLEPMRDVRAAGGKPAMAVGSTIRYAVQIASHLPDTSARNIRFGGSRLAADSVGQPVLEIDVENSGTQAYRPLLWIEVYDSQGTLRAKAQHQRGLLYPGTSVRQRFALDEVGRGAHKVIVYADTGDESVFASELKVEL